VFIHLVRSVPNLRFQNGQQSRCKCNEKSTRYVGNTVMGRQGESAGQWEI